MFDLEDALSQPVDSSRCRDRGGGKGEERQFQHFPSKCRANFFPPGENAITTWRCKNPLMRYVIFCVAQTASRGALRRASARVKSFTVLPRCCSLSDEGETTAAKWTVDVSLVWTRRWLSAEEYLRRRTRLARVLPAWHSPTLFFCLSLYFTHLKHTHTRFLSLSLSPPLFAHINSTIQNYRGHFSERCRESGVQEKASDFC